MISSNERLGGEYGMINILSIRSPLALAPYLYESLSEYVTDGKVTPRAVRQGGIGISIGPEQGFTIRHQGRSLTLDGAAVAHYHATVGLRCEFYDVSRTSNEIVMANVGHELMLSHPQSGVWMTAETVAALLSLREGAAEPRRFAVPEWLNVSVGEGQLLLSDSRTGRWVLLGDDHIVELRQRSKVLVPFPDRAALSPPSINLKGITIRLQSVYRLARALEAFASSGEVETFADVAPSYSLSMSAAQEGIELRDQNNRVALTRREADKWSELLRSEIAAANATEIRRGPLTTVVASGPRGRWVLQLGDEVFVPDEARDSIRSSSFQSTDLAIVIRTRGEYVVVLDPRSGACVALTASELELVDEKP